MEVYRAVVEALGFVVTGAERGLVALLKEELKVARRTGAMREAAREGPRVGRMSRGSGSSRAASRLDDELRRLEDEMREEGGGTGGREEGVEGGEEGTEVQGHPGEEPSVEGNDVAGDNGRGGGGAGGKQAEEFMQVLEDQGMAAEELERRRMLPGVRAIWVSRYLRVALGLVKSAASSKAPNSRKSSMY
jgi:hypothetical protein